MPKFEAIRIIYDGDNISRMKTFETLKKTMKTLRIKIMNKIFCILVHC